jgi:hypothetical protein
MPRRNGPKPLANYFDGRGLSHSQIEGELARRRERTERRIDARVSAAVDPEICCIPGCETKLPHYGFGGPVHLEPVDYALPLCPRHLTIIGKQANRRWVDPDIQAARAKYADQYVVKEIKARKDGELRRKNGGVPGQIYFVRQNGLVKVGWSSQLTVRLKDYGANVEVLCHFPGTRSDETNLHRQLRPYLAQGREWYMDCPLIRDVVAGYVKQHGEPTLKPYWTRPKAPTVKVRRAS